MSKNVGSPTTAVNNKIAPDFFGFYTNEVGELLSRDSQLGENMHDEVGKERGSAKNSKTKENNGINSSTPFSNGIGALISEFKKERLKSLLRQSVFTLTKEVDELIDPVLSICRIRSCLKCKGHLLRLDSSACKVDQPHQPFKRLKKGSSNGPIKHSDTKYDNECVDECVEIDDDLRFILESDTTKVEELMKNHSNEFSSMLNHMEQKLEELLNISMTSCRPMTLAEKQHLRKSIQNLPPKNLDRVAEIIGCDEKYSCSEVHVDLEGMDNVTLWRLHFYITTIQVRTV